MTDPRELSRRLLAGDAPRRETAEALRDALLAGDSLPAGGDHTAYRPDDYAAALDAAFAAAPALAGERRTAEDRTGELLAALTSLPAAERAAAVRGEARFHSWALAEALGEASFAAGLEDAESAVDLARLSVAVAEATAAAGDPQAARSCEPPGTPPRLAADLTALAYGQLANAQRIAADQPATERSLSTAFGHLRRGTGDPLVRARLLGFAASLRSDQSRFDDAVRLARRAARLQHRYGDEHGFGRMQVKLANFHAYRDELEIACELLEAAQARLDVEAEPRLAYAVHHNRASYLDRLGRYPEAAAELAAAEPLATAPLDRLRWTWLSGRVTAHLGNTAVGEAKLRQARRELVAREMGYDVACISLDLALLYAEQGRGSDMKRLAEEMLPLFQSRQVEPEARAALRLYCDAARAETAGLALVEEVAERLRRLGQRG
jgi:hypothetical protein